MKARPTIFLSGVSSEFGTFRDAVEIEVQKKGCFAENQSSFAPDYRTVEEMLHRKLHDADAVIHLVGFRFGTEPRDRPSGQPRRSYTQMEFDIAREMQKPIYVLLSENAGVRDEPKPGEKPEDDDMAVLQNAHRQAVQSTDYLYYFFNDETELRRLAAEIGAVAGGFRADISRIVEYTPTELIGREAETKLLADAWEGAVHGEKGRPHILAFVALGGEGKTSLVAKWASNLADQDWPGCNIVFAWSFYSQGTREQMAASSDLFLKEALTFFGDAAMANSAQVAFDKGKRLAQLVGERRALLILDGVEPLQYAPTSPTPGELKDQGLAALLKGLAATNGGLCVVTTRYAIPDLRAFLGKTVREEKLMRLSQEAGVALLMNLGVKGTPPEFETLVEDVQGHALTLNLLGSFLRDAHAGDIRRRDLVKLEEADAEEQGGHAFRVLDAYVQALEHGGKSEEDKGKGRRALALLELLGLFDRPATADCLNALWQGEAIAGLTEPLLGLSEAQRNLSLTRLEDAKLLTVNREAASGVLVALDTHPLLREYFAKRLREQQPAAWRAAHRRLYEHLCATTKEGDQPTLEDLQPLYQAVAHGCQAGLQQEVHDHVYVRRILRGTGSNGFYSIHNLGAIGSDLGAIVCFFETPWRQVSPQLRPAIQASLLNVVAYLLKGLGRLAEATEPTLAGLEMRIKQENWKLASTDASNLSDLEMTLGEVAGAVGNAERSVTYADRSYDAFLRCVHRVNVGDALHQAGRWAEADARFREAEQMQGESQPDYPLLYSLQGFQYCDLLLTEAECAAWQLTLDSSFTPHLSSLSASCRAVSERTAQTLKWAERNYLGLLTIALDHLTLGRAALYAGILESSRSDFGVPRSDLDAAVAGLRRAGKQDHLPRGLLTRAWLRFLTGQRTGPESAQSDLDEAWEIAERGPMRLFMADIHLYRARLFRCEKPYPWQSPQADLAAAEKLINECGYHRRDQELADAKAALVPKQ